MFLKDKEFSKQDIEFTKSFIEDKIQNGEIDAEIGAGFSVLSKGQSNIVFLNVNVWRRDEPEVLRNKIYICEENPKNLCDADLADLHTEGAYCIWEQQVLHYESHAWAEFLRSKYHTEMDLDHYFGKTFRGEIKLGA